MFDPLPNYLKVNTVLFLCCPFLLHLNRPNCTIALGDFTSNFMIYGKVPSKINDIPTVVIRSVNCFAFMVFILGSYDIVSLTIYEHTAGAYLFPAAVVTLF